MNKPSDETINNAIAFYMGLTDGVMVDDLIPKYTESLDAMVEVVEKLGVYFSIRHVNISLGEWTWEVEHLSSEAVRTNTNLSPSRALAMACYEVIKDE